MAAVSAVSGRSRRISLDKPRTDTFGQIVGGDLATFPGCEKQVDMPIANEMRGISGLVNLGNTCFMNAGLQCIIANPRIAHFFLSAYRQHRAALNEQFKELVAAVREDEERRRNVSKVQPGSNPNDESASVLDSHSSAPVASTSCSFGSFAADLDSELRASAPDKIALARTDNSSNTVATSTDNGSQTLPSVGTDTLKPVAVKFNTEQQSQSGLIGCKPALTIMESQQISVDFASNRTFSALIDCDPPKRVTETEEVVHAQKLLSAADIDVTRSDITNALHRSRTLHNRNGSIASGPQPPPPPPPPPPPLQGSANETQSSTSKAGSAIPEPSQFYNAPVAVDDDVLTVIHLVERQAELSRSGIGKSRLSAVASVLERKLAGAHGSSESSAIDVDAEVEAATASAAAPTLPPSDLDRNVKPEEATSSATATVAPAGPSQGSEAERRGAQFRKMVERCVRQIALVDSLHDLVEYAWSGRAAAAVFKPRRFKQHLGALYNQFANARQHDAQEFLAVLLDCAHEVLNVRRSPFASAERSFRDASRLFDELDAVDRDRVTAAAAAATDKATQCIPPPNAALDANTEAEVGNEDAVNDKLGGFTKRKSKIENENVNFAQLDGEPIDTDCSTLGMRTDSEKFRNATPQAPADSECDSIANTPCVLDKSTSGTINVCSTLLNGSTSCHSMNANGSYNFASTSKQHVDVALDPYTQLENGKTPGSSNCSCKSTNVLVEQETTVSSSTIDGCFGGACPDDVVVRLNKRLRIDSSRPQSTVPAENNLAESMDDIENELDCDSTRSRKVTPPNDVSSMRRRTTGDMNTLVSDADATKGTGCTQQQMEIDRATQQNGVKDCLFVGNAPVSASNASVVEGMETESESDGQAEWSEYVARNDSAVADAFHGQLRSVIVCSSCSFRSVTYEPFMYLPVPIPRAMQAAVTVLFVPASNDTPTRYCVSMFQNDSVAALKRELLKLVGAPEDSELAIGEAIGPTVLRVVRDDKTLIRTLAHRQLVAVEFCSPSAALPSRPVTAPVPAPATTPAPAPTESFTSNQTESTMPAGKSEVEFSPLAVGSSSEQPVEPATAISNSVQPSAQTTEAFPELSRCLICLDEFRADVMRVHPTCNLMLCVDCVAKCAEHACGTAGGTRFGCPGECHEQVTIEDYVPVATLYATCALLLSGGADTMPTHTVYLTVLFRNDTVADPASSSVLTERDSTASGDAAIRRELFGHALLVALPNRVTAEALWNELDRLVPSCVADCSYQLCLTDASGSRCARCDSQSRCVGCPVARDEQRVLLLRDGHDTITIAFECLSQEQRTAASAVKEHDSVRLARAHDATLTLHDCIRAFTDPEALDLDNPWLCPRCDRPQPATKILSIARFPETLIIYLKRFVFHALESYKANETVLFPYEHLAMGEYGTHPSNSSARMASEAGWSKGETGSDCTYDLTGIVCHFGGVNAGHYTAYTRHAVSHCWHYFNDETVTQREPVDDDFRNAYVLFYTRAPCSSSGCDERASFLAALPRVVLYRPLQETDDYEQQPNHASDQQPVLALTYQPTSSPMPTPTTGDSVQGEYYGPYLPGCEPPRPLCNLRESVSQIAAVSSSTDMVPSSDYSVMVATSGVQTQSDELGPTAMQVDVTSNTAPTTFDQDEQIALALSMAEYND